MKITVIPQSKKMFSSEPLKPTDKRKVAAYARVSTDQDEQLNSYEAQVDYYTTFISAHDEWSFVGIYTDEGISGTSTARRTGFKRMVADALEGKIDLIVTKSVSRFARNTVDSLTVIRLLKEHGVEVYFEKESIWTFDSKGELLITIMSSLAQEESRSISENITWGQRKRFADGRVSIAYGQFLGYNRSEDGKMVIDEEEAEVVRTIYRLCMLGFSPTAIADYLTEHEISTPSGKERWHASVVRSILRNEKYRGDALLQKTFTIDFLKKKLKVNEGEVPMYYVHEDHEAIIDPYEFELVQAEIESSHDNGMRYKHKHTFTGELICACCNGKFGSKIWHSNDKYNRKMWQCNNRFKKGNECRMPSIPDDIVKRMFAAACLRYVEDHPQIAADRKAMFAHLGDGKDLDRQIKELKVSIHEYDILMSAGQNENTSRRMKELRLQRDEARVQLERLMEERRSFQKRKRLLKANLELACEQTYYQKRMVKLVLEHGIVQEDKSILFVFRDGYSCLIPYQSKSSEK